MTSRVDPWKVLADEFPGRWRLEVGLKLQVFNCKDGIWKKFLSLISDFLLEEDTCVDRII